MNEHTHTNRLADEKSPYLLQHAHNPVDWYPWSEEAFDKARAEDKPVFLSIGYSTCHWCHVMERESFEDEEVAALLNEHFVSIKVDREERPDIDAVYMTVCQMMTGTGGWPLTVLLAPDKRPFFAATYIPKGSRLQRVGMMELVPRVAEMWRDKRDEITRSGDRIAEILTAPPKKGRGAALDEKLLDQAQSRLSRRFDPEHGGFSRAPKFPTPHNFTFLLRDERRSGRAESRHMVVETLEQMRRGGIWDHVGFGFHRYSTDRHWLVPHFEKMLYDQALLALAYTEAHVVTGRDDFADVVRETFAYLRRDLTSPEGAFFSAEDADSEGEEGRFYLWTLDEVREQLGAEEGDLFAGIYGMTQDGNYADEATGQRDGRNIPHLSRDLAQAAEERGLEREELARRLDAARETLLEHRSKRVRPSLDDKVLTDWNGLAIAALARAGRALDEPEMLEAARTAADFVTTRMVGDDGLLLHRWREGEAAVHAFLDDYAFMVWGLLELHQATLETAWLEQAVELTDEMLDRFWDDEGGGFFLSSSTAELVIARQKDAYDGAIPSGNSVAATNLLRLARLTGRSDFGSRAMETLEAFATQLERSPEGFTHLLQALGLALGRSAEVVVVGEPGHEDTQALLDALRSRFLPEAVLIQRDADGRDDALARLAPFTTKLVPVDGRATAYVCHGHVCELPTTEASQMLEMVAAAKVGSGSLNRATDGG